LVGALESWQPSESNLSRRVSGIAQVCYGFFSRPIQLAGKRSLTQLGRYAVPRALVRSPSQKFRAMPKPTAREVIVLDLGDQYGLEWMPLANPMTKLGGKNL